MTFFEKVKQVWIQLNLEKNPNYYTVLDIQRCINEISHVMTKHKLDRTQMREATFYLQSLREYKDVIGMKTNYSQTVNMKELIGDVYMEINTANKFVDSVLAAENIRREDEFGY